MYINFEFRPRYYKLKLELDLSVDIKVGFIDENSKKNLEICFPSSFNDFILYKINFSFFVQKINRKPLMVVSIKFLSNENSP